ncbi:MAG TPA: NAD(P)/FAD-dependent oxidoreductase [Acidobacteriaceae bacterium]|nr:NAD(P)/FAD-dependent oxidoreductase [Acidobacteriaceae bacterium]
MTNSASIIGSGPNGLAAAIVLAQAGLKVDVYEAEPMPGGAARTMPLTLPGFRHDFGSAAHPLAIGSPFFSTLPLDQHGLQWIHSPSVLAHPLDNGTATLIRRDFDYTARFLFEDGSRWRSIFEPFATQWPALTDDILGPVLHRPRHLSLFASFGFKGRQSAASFAKSHFNGVRTRSLFAGIAAHSGLSLAAPFSAAPGLVLAIAAHAVGWPIPRGGAQSITNALIAHLKSLGGEVHTSRRISSLAELPDTLTLCDIAPSQLVQIAGDRLSLEYIKSVSTFKYGPGAFKIDYALSQPIPWLAADCMTAATVHIGGTLEEIAHSEKEVAQGRVSDKPFLLLTQPSLFDSTRAPDGQHTAWVYCHVPNGSEIDMTERIENQIERFAPGFRKIILARCISTPSDLQAVDANLIGGDVNGGAMNFRQLLFRPSPDLYATSNPKIYLCSASTPPGGGVHGMCGFRAASLALRRQK